MSATPQTFRQLGLPIDLTETLARLGITTPFPIQEATLPDTLAGRDVLGRGRTGSGKTLAFALPMVDRLRGGRRQPLRPRGLILAPTRELATQIAATLEPLAAAAGLRTTTIFGGVPQGRQVTALKQGIDILVACPGRLEDLMRQGFCRLDAVEITVLDEADHMADLGFLPGVKRLLDATPRGGQRMLFSATLDNGVDVLVRRYLVDPITHSVDSAVAPIAASTHHVLSVASMDDKNAVVRELAGGMGRRLLFTRTKHGAKKLAKQLTAAGVPAVDLHGNLSQNARERNLAAFSSGDIKVLVATDIAARGIHVDDIDLVVHVDPPTEHKAYLHRSGRTARAGATGDVVTVMLPEQQRDVRLLARQAGINPVTTQVRPGADYTRELVGAAAPFITPALVAPTVDQPRQRSAGSRSGSPRTPGARSGSGGESRSSSSRSSAGRGSRAGGGGLKTYSTSTPGSATGSSVATRAGAPASPGRASGAVAVSRAGGPRRRGGSR